MISPDRLSVCIIGKKGDEVVDLGYSVDESDTSPPPKKIGNHK